MALNFLNNGYFAGKVGIGTDSPVGILEVAGNTDTDANFLIIKDKDTSAGSARPSIRFAKSDGTVLGQLLALDGTNQRLQFSGNNTQDPHLTVYNDGNVGIGTTSPNANLDILNGTTGASLKLSATTTAYWQLQRNPTTGNLNISDDALGDVMSFDQLTGNVGIGTTTPVTKLEISDDTAPTLTLRNPSANPANSGMIRFIESTNTDGFQLTFNGSDNKLKFISDSGGTEVTRMVIQRADGHVGIGTTTPTAPLHIEGGTNSEVLKIEADSNPFVRWVENGTNVGFLQFLGDNAYLSNMSNGSFFFRTNNTDKMTILAGGNVGIGTTSPGLKLDINSGTANSALRVLSTDRYTGIKFEDDTNNDTLFYDGQSDLMYLGSTNFRAVDLHATGNLRVEGAIYDSNNSPGTANQVLISTVTGTDWVDGSGSSIIGGPYLPLSGGTMTGTAGVVFPDNFNLKIGTGSDLKIFHNATDSFIINEVGDFYISNQADNKDIVFTNDNGSGGTTTYFQLDSSQASSPYVYTRFPDYSVAAFGNGNNLQVYHTDTTGFISEYEGDLKIINHADDKDIQLMSDDGSGGVTTYLRLDGGIESLIAYKDLLMAIDGDGGKIKLGASQDLQLFHDGNDSYIQDGGAGNLLITSNGASVQINKGTTENMAEFIVDGAVKLYYDSARKLETTSTGVSVTGSAFFVRSGTNGTTASPYYETILSSGISSTNLSAIQLGNTFGSDNGTELRFQINNTSGASTPINSLLLNTSGATFEGDITTKGDIIIDNSSGDPFLKLKTSAQEYVLRIDQSDSEKFQIRNTTSSVTALSIDTSSNATFASNVNLPTANYLRFTPAASSSDARILYGNTTGTDGSIAFTRNSDSSTMFKVTGSGNAEITGKGTSSATITSDASSTLTTKGYVDSLITGATIYRGTWDPDVSLNSGYGNPNLNTVTQTSGYYYICSADGAATPNGATTEPNTWNTGDWVIWNDDIGASGEWQKIDNSSVLSGVGTGQTVALWEGASSVTDSETLGNAPITVSGNNTTFAGSLTIPEYIIHAGDTDTKFGFAGVNDYRVHIGGSDRFRITGDVHVKGATDFAIPAARKLYLDGQSNTYITESSADNIKFFTGGSEALLLNSSQNATFAGDVTAPTFLGDLNGTINTATTGTTQSAGNNSTLIATTAYADAAAGAVPIGSYLPLAGGTMSGSIVFNNNVAETWKDNAGATTRMMILNSANIAYIGPIDTYAGGPILYGTSADVTAQVFYTGASERMRITSAGNVGIGTTSPSAGAKLEVIGKGDQLGSTGFYVNSSFKDDANVGVFICHDDTINTTGAIAGINQLSFITYGGTSPAWGERMKITDAGNVGINTTSPESKLTIKGDPNNTDQPVRITNSTVDAKTGLFINGTGNSPNQKYGMQFGGYNQYSIGGIFGLLDSVSGSTSGDITFDMCNGTSAGSLIERMRITHEGNVGIGTASPNNETNRVSLELNDTWGGVFQNSVSGTPKSEWRWSTGGQTFFGSIVSEPLVLTTNNTSRIFIEAGGNVGIGTTNPIYKLTVSGGIEAGGKVTYTKSSGSLNTTGYAVAGITALPSGNGFSCGFTFTCFGGSGKYQRLVYSCYNSGGTWNAKKVIDEGTNDLDVVASANGSTITFTFKARSSTQSFTPRVTVEATGHSINSTYA